MDKLTCHLHAKSLNWSKASLITVFFKTLLIKKLTFETDNFQTLWTKFIERKLGTQIRLYHFLQFFAALNLKTYQHHHCHMECSHPKHNCVSLQIKLKP